MSRGPMENEAAAARPVVIRPCAGYSEAEARSALEAVLAPLGGLHWVKPGMCVAIKANLITAIRPENAATTHPALLGALTRLLLERGARVVIGDSPGGVFNRVYVERVYEVCGLRALEDLGAALNRDFRQRDQAFPQGKVLKSFTVTSWLDEADAVINFCKLKVHAMMAMTAATKNLFGIVPGAVKAEYHYRFPRYEDFADMLVDLNEYLKPRLNICDAVVAMEGNGPTQGTPKALGAILASESPYALDLAAAWLLDLKKEDVPYLEAAYRRGLIPAEAGLLTVDGDPAAFRPRDFKNVAARSGITHFFKGNGPVSRLTQRAVGSILQNAPRLDAAGCVGCGVCARSCPAEAITIEDKKAKIDRKRCIRCFCCQELCPKGAMRVHRPLAARIAGKL